MSRNMFREHHALHFWRVVTNRTYFLHMLLAVLLVGTLVGCGATQNTTSRGGGASQWGLPFHTGEMIQIGGGDGSTAGGLHDDNFHAVGGFTFQGAGSVMDASLDLITQRGAGVPVTPLASGHVLLAYAPCRLVIVDHGGGIWVEYLHLQVAVSTGQTVDRNTTLGTTIPAYPKTSCGDWSTAPHVHFAFIRATGSTTGQYVSMQGFNLCGYTVNAHGDLPGLGVAGASIYFPTPNCDTGSTGGNSSHDGESFVSQSANPTTVSVGQPVTISFTERNSGTTTWSDSGGYRLSCEQNCFGLAGAGLNGQTVSPGQTYQFTITFPFSFSEGTYRTVWAMTHNGTKFGHDLWIDIHVVAASLPPSNPPSNPPSQPATCSTPSLASPWNGAGYSTSDTVTLSWNTDCSQSYAELWGGPTGTLSFNGWQSGTSISIGTMWPATYQWHVKGISVDGVQTNWSSIYSFTVSGTTSGPSPTPAPPATPTPTWTPAPPQATPTNTPCPYINNNGQYPTFYAQTNWQGQGQTFYLNPGQDLYFTFPTWLQQNLESFTDPYSAFHIVTFHTATYGGNLAHWDTAQPGPLQAVDGYQYSASVEIYFRRSC